MAKSHFQINIYKGRDSRPTTHELYRSESVTSIVCTAPPSRRPSNKSNDDEDDEDDNDGGADALMPPSPSLSASAPSSTAPTAAPTATASRRPEVQYGPRHFEDVGKEIKLLVCKVDERGKKVDLTSLVATGHYKLKFGAMVVDDAAAAAAAAEGDTALSATAAPANTTVVANATATATAHRHVAHPPTQARSITRQLREDKGKKKQLYDGILRVRAAVEFAPLALRRKQLQDQINSSNRQVLMTRVGRSIGDYVVERTLEDAYTWALSYANNNTQEVLQEELYALCDQVKRYVLKQRREARQADRARAANASSGSLASQAISMSEASTDHDRDRNEDGGDGEEWANLLKGLGLSEQAGTANGRSHGRGRKKSSGNRKDRRKQLTLTQRLEQAAQQGTQQFEQFITSGQDAGVAAAARSGRTAADPASPPRSPTGAARRVPVTALPAYLQPAAHWSPSHDSLTALARPASIRAAASAEFTPIADAAPGGGGERRPTASSNQEESEPALALVVVPPQGGVPQPPPPSTARRSRHTSAQSHRVMKHAHSHAPQPPGTETGAGIGAELVPWSPTREAAPAGATTDIGAPPVRKPSVPTQPNRAEREALAREKKEQGVDQYSNLDRDYLAGMERKLDRAFGIFEGKMEYFVHDAQNRSKKVANYRRRFQRKERAAEVAAQQVVEHCGAFQKAQAHQRRYALHVVDDRAFERPSNMKAKMAFFTMGRMKQAAEGAEEKPSTAPAALGGMGMGDSSAGSSRASLMMTPRAAGMEESPSKSSLNSRSSRMSRAGRHRPVGLTHGSSVRSTASRGGGEGGQPARSAAPEDETTLRLSAAMEAMRAMSVRTAEVTQDLIAYSTAREGSRSPPRPLYLLEPGSPPGAPAPSLLRNTSTSLKASLKASPSVSGLDSSAKTSQKMPPTGALFAPVAPAGAAVTEAPTRPTFRTVSFSLDDGRSAEDTFFTAPTPMSIATAVVAFPVQPPKGAPTEGALQLRLGASGGPASPTPSKGRGTGTAKSKRGSGSNLTALVEEPETSDRTAAAAAARKDEVSEVCRLEMEMVRRKARRTQMDAQLAQVAEHLWFVAAVFRVQATAGGATAAAAAAAPNKDLPPCCCRFLGLVQRLLSHGFGGNLDAALFYRAVEDTVTDGRDLAKPVVHRTVFAVAEHVGIGPEAFLAYLEGRKLPPSSELLAMVSANKARNERRDQRAAALAAANAANAATAAAGGAGGAGVAPGAGHKRRALSSRDSFASSVGGESGDESPSGNDRDSPVSFGPSGRNSPTSD